MGIKRKKLGSLDTTGFPGFSLFCSFQNRTKLKSWHVFSKYFRYLALLVRVQVRKCIKRCFISSWPNRSLMVSGETPNSIKWLAWLCPYGIITTNRKSPVFQGFSVIRQGFHPFPTRKIKPRSSYIVGGVILTTKTKYRLGGLSACPRNQDISSEKKKCPFCTQNPIPTGGKQCRRKPRRKSMVK